MDLDDRGRQWTQPLLDLATVEVLGARPRELAGHLQPDLLWPCPLCGRRRPLIDSWSLTVRNLTHPPHEREVAACAECAARAGASAADG